MNKNLVNHLPTIALVASLIFVAFELRQNQNELEDANKYARAEALATSLESAQNMRHFMAEHSTIWNRAIQGKELTDDEIWTVFAICGDNLWIPANTYRYGDLSGDSTMISMSKVWAKSMAELLKSACSNNYLMLKPIMVSGGYSEIVEIYDQTFL